MVAFFFDAKPEFLRVNKDVFKSSVEFLFLLPWTIKCLLSIPYIYNVPITSELLAVLMSWECRFCGVL